MRRWLMFMIAVACFAYQDGAKTINVPLPSNADVETIRQADQKKNLQDVEELVRIAEAMKTRIEKESPWVVSVKTVQDTDEIEKLVARIRGRFKTN